MNSEQLDTNHAPVKLPASCWPRPDGVLTSMKVTFSQNSQNQACLRAYGAQIKGRFHVGGRWVSGSFLLDTGAAPMFISKSFAEQSVDGALTGEPEISFHAAGIAETMRVTAKFEFEGVTDGGAPVTFSFASTAIVTPSIVPEPPASMVGVIGRDVLTCGNLTYDGQTGWWLFTVDYDSMKTVFGDSVSVETHPNGN